MLRFVDGSYLERRQPLKKNQEKQGVKEQEMRTSEQVGLGLMRHYSRWVDEEREPRQEHNEE